MVRIPAVLVLLGAASLSACDVYDQVDRPLPALKAFTLDNRPLQPSALEGKPWVIALWVPGCVPCARELPELDEVRREWEPKGVGFLALSLHPDVADVREFMQRFGVGMKVAIAQDQVLGPLGVTAVPSTVFVGANGRIVATANGARSRGFFERRITELLPSGS